MLNSIKRKVLLLCCLCLFSQVLFAQLPRNYVILWSSVNKSRYPYLGSITVFDQRRALFARVHFPGGHDVDIRMQVQTDGRRVFMHIDPLGQTFLVPPSPPRQASSTVDAITMEAGLPSAWFTNPNPALYQFQLPEIEPHQRIVFNEFGKNWVGDIALELSRPTQVEIRNVRYLRRQLVFEPGTNKDGRVRLAWNRMTNLALLQLTEMLVVVLISPQLHAGHHLVTRPDEMQPLNETQENTGEYESSPLTGRIQGYIFWVLGMFGWERHLMTEPLPLNYPGSGEGVVIDGRQNPGSYIIQPFIVPVSSSPEGATSYLSPFSGASTGVPPQYCRGGAEGWQNQRKRDGGADPGVGGGFSGYSGRHSQ